LDHPDEAALPNDRTGRDARPACDLVGQWADGVYLQARMEGAAECVAMSRAVRCLAGLTLDEISLVDVRGPGGRFDIARS
jgi:hypothetical protein